ncbi:MAG: hypothetical protein ABIC95_00415 [archaeon]
MSPAKASIDFQPGLEQEFTYTIHNTNAGKDIYVDILLAGELAKYCEPGTERINIKRGSSGSITFKIKLPETTNGLTPGMNIVGINAKEGFPNGEGGSTINVLTAIEGWLIVNVPYPGKYAEVRLNIPSVKEGLNTAATVDIRNRGKDDLRGTSGALTITGPNGELMERIELSNIDIKNQEQEVISRDIESADWVPGKYRGDLVYDYGGDKPIETSNDFHIGTLEIKISDYSRQLFRDELNPFEVRVESQWNERINGVYAEISLEGKETVKTPTANLAPFSQDILVGYLDTTGLEGEGVSGKILLHYADGLKSERDIKVLLVEKERPSVFSSMLAGINWMMVVIVALVVLIVALVAINISFMKKVKGDDKKKK